MTATNDFLPFGTGGSADVLSQAAWLALLGTTVANGFTTGIADPATCNKLFRQSSFGVAALAQLMTDVLQANVQDDGVVANFEAQLADMIRGRVKYADDTGTANTYAIAPAPSATAYAKGQEYAFKAANSNTGASTLNVNSLGTKSIVRRNGSALQAADIIAGQIVTVKYDGTSFQIVGARIATSSLGLTGWKIDDDGFIEQWGSVTTSASADVTWTFPITFPAQCFQVVGTQVNNAGTLPTFISTGTATQTGAVIAGWSASAGGARISQVAQLRAIGK